MDEDTIELVRSLCTRAGMIMEDASLIAVTMPRAWTDNAQEALDRLLIASGTINQLITAAEMLVQRPLTKIEND